MSPEQEHPARPTTLDGFERVYREHAGRVYTLALRNGLAVGAWLRTITVNLVVSRNRGHFRRMAREVDAEDCAGIASSPGESAEKRLDLESAEVTTVSGAITASCTFAYQQAVNYFRASSDRGPINLALPSGLAASFELALTPGVWIAQDNRTGPAAGTTTWEELTARLQVSPETPETAGSLFTVTSVGTVIVGSHDSLAASQGSRIDKLTRSFSTGSDSTQICLTSRDGTISVEFRDLP